MLVGNKADMLEREVKTEEGELACKTYGCIGYYETSASANINVDEAFFSVATKAFQKEEEANS